jgi:hypothetical protein
VQLNSLGSKASDPGVQGIEGEVVCGMPAETGPWRTLKDLSKGLEKHTGVGLTEWGVEHGLHQGDQQSVEKGLRPALLAG